MGYVVYTLVWASALVIQQCRGGSSSDQVSMIQNALTYLEDMIDRMDTAMQAMHIYEYDYTSWSECSATCGIGYKWREKIQCDMFQRDDCVEMLYCISQPCPMEPKPKKVRYATCVMRRNPEAPGTGQNVRGVVRFRQEEKKHLKISINITGFDAQPFDATPSQLDHGFHIHEYGDLSGGCGTAGGHFNPKGVSHGGRLDSVRHVGDLGNIRQTPGGNVVDEFTDNKASLFGDNSIVGRALVIHRDQDDLGQGGDAGSQATGNAGPRLACCVIGLAEGQEEDDGYSTVIVG